MRKYALVILDNKDEVFDRYPLDITTNPTGNGFELEMSTISSDLEDIITKVIQKKNKITFVVQQISDEQNDSYEKANNLAQWIQKFSTTKYKMVLEYDDGNVVRYCEGKVTKLEKDEKTYRNVLQQRLEFTQTTPYFIKRDNTITIEKGTVGKSYPYTYPYNYLTSDVANNSIVNPYILDVPLIIIIEGRMDNVLIELIDEEGKRYNTVQLLDKDGSALILQENETLIINAAQRKIIKINTLGQEEDYTNLVSPLTDTFLIAKSGVSTIGVNQLSMGEKFKLTGSWRQYSL